MAGTEGGCENVDTGADTCNTGAQFTEDIVEMEKSELMNIDDIDKALVVGLGYRTGLTVSNFLANRGIDTYVSDSKSESELSGIISQLKPGITLLLGRQKPDILDDEEFDAIILSPGVPVSIPLIVEANRRKIPVISEIELAYKLIKGKIIAITGTDGKTTTTTLTGHILKSLGYKTFVGGNIGTPVLSFAEETDESSFTVIELSSFQLETIREFRPHVASILNVTPDHMDRYSDMDDYSSAKLRIAMNQKRSDTFIYNLDDAILTEGLNHLESKKLSFSLKKGEADAYFSNGLILLREGKKKSRIIVEAAKLQILGLHNIQNTLAAVLMVNEVLEMSGREPDYPAIAEACVSFPPLEHRMENIGEYEGRIFINDSKATTIGSVEMALQSIPGKGVIILGGRSKGDDYSRLAESMKGRVRGIVLLGETREEFAELFSEFKNALADDLDQAVGEAMRLSSQGDVILLSPACASFDMFRNYEVRGEEFKKSFEKLKRGDIPWT
jgi:UDP-N-acetylmuramoylalanine--D-glutamate ligase